MNPIDSANLVAAICDTLLPGDDLFPPASTTGTHGIVAGRLRDRYGPGILADLARDLTVDGRAFATLDEDARVAALRRLEAEQPEVFTFLLMAAYLAYYATPPVIEAIRQDGHEYNDAPQPRGYDLKKFEFVPGPELPLEPRGSFKWTIMMERIDLSSLSDLDLPTGRERA